MKAIELSKYSQDLIEKTRKNYYKLKKLCIEDLNKQIIELAKEFNIAPVVVLRYRYKLLGYTNNAIKNLINLNTCHSEDERNEILKVSSCDPVYSKIGLDYISWKGKEAENIIKDWLDHQKHLYKKDPGNDQVGKPDFLLEHPIQINNNFVDWIESKCSYGDYIEQKNNENQITKFEKLHGERGLIIYWFGFKPNSRMRRRFILTWKEMLQILPEHLHPRVENLINYIPKEFENLDSRMQVFR